MRRRSLAFGRFIAIVVSIAAWLALPTPAPAQIAAGKAKFVGSAMGGSAPANFATYWNQVTPENGTKWGTVEGTRNVMNWGQAHVAYDYAISRGYKFKGHTLIWGAQFPSWLTQLSQAQQRAEIEEWMRLFGQQFPQAWAVDVVNEPIKTPLPFKAALGGDGATGWDWVITSFQLARQFLPNAKLLINEYGTENDPNARNQYLTIINLLRSRGLLDGIGVQAHYFNLDSMNASQMTTALNAYAATGLDVYISELDITGGGSDSGQLAKYQELFPTMWNHASVKGITLWGYIVGQTWRDGTGLVNSNGAERPAMTWLKGFVSGGGPVGSGVWLEAERGTVGATWNDNIGDGAASAGQYVAVKPGNNSTASAPTTAAGWVSLPFNVSQSGTYRMWIRRITPTADDDSFWVRMDNGTFAMWNGIPVATSWAWAQYPTTFNLSAGSHTLVFGYREDGALLDKVYLTSGTDTPTGTGGPASNVVGSTQGTRLGASEAANIIDTADLAGTGRNDGTSEHVLQLWAEERLDDALAFARSQPAGPKRDMFLARVARVQAARDPAQAALLATQEMTRGPARREATLDVLNQWALQDPEAAAEWVNTLPDATLRKPAQATLARAIRLREDGGAAH